MNLVFLSLGSNLGDKLEILKSAIKEISLEIGNIDKCSHVYESMAIGFQADETFYNLCLQVSTTMSAEEILRKALKIEEHFGRERITKGYASRTLDIDIIYYNDEIIHSEELILPHPRMQERLFVLLPLNDLIDNKLHPILRKNTRELIDNLPNQDKPIIIANRKQLEY